MGMPPYVGRQSFADTERPLNTGAFFLVSNVGMRTLALLLAMVPALAFGQEPTVEVSPPKKATKDQVYKWVDKDGVVHYSSQPPTDNAKPAKLPPLQTYKGGTVPKLEKFDKAPPKANTGYAQIQIVAPSHDETFRGGERVVPVGVLVTPALEPNQRLIYLLDGTPASAPTTDTSFALTGVDRGTHTVTVSLVDATGNELASSNSVTFHVKPPTADQSNKQKQPGAKPTKP